MAYKIEVDIVDPGDGEIKVTHTFWGHTEAEARTNYTHHLAACDYFQANAEAGNVIEEEYEISEDELPVVEEDDDEPEICEDCELPVDECTC